MSVVEEAMGVEELNMKMYYFMPKYMNQKHEEWKQEKKARKTSLVNNS